MFTRRFVRPPTCAPPVLVMSLPIPARNGAAVSPTGAIPVPPAADIPTAVTASGVENAGSRKFAPWTHTDTHGWRGSGSSFHGHHQRAQEKVDKYRAGYAAQRMCHAFLPAVVSTSGRIHRDILRLLDILDDKMTTRYFEHWVRPSMSILRATGGGGAGISGACGRLLAWHAHRQLPCALKFSAKHALGLITVASRATAPVSEQHHLTSDLGLSLHRM